MRFNPDEYIPVSERIDKFYAKYPAGRILTDIVEHNEETGFILMKATMFREADDAEPSATGHAYELRSAGHVQAGSYVEVCETSAVGRALALLGFEVQRGVASREEVRRGQAKSAAAASPETRRTPKPTNPRITDETAPPPTAAQLQLMQELADLCAVDLPKAISKTFGDETLGISELNTQAVAYMNELLQRKKAELGLDQPAESREGGA